MPFYKVYNLSPSLRMIVREMQVYPISKCPEKYGALVVI
jgi:sulfur relay (sulfurtransferase) DsrC/TusE family protein